MIDTATCHAEITDEAWTLQPCDQPAVGWRTRDLAGEQPWPACRNHIDAIYLGDGQWKPTA